MRSLSIVPKIIVFVGILSSMLAPAVARAENQNPAKAQALARLQEGNAFLGQGRATDALSKFTEAYRLFPSPKLHYNIGQAHSLIPGHEAQAYESMTRFLTEAVDANPQLRSGAETQRQQLRPKVGLVSVTADPPDADLIVDDVNVGRVTPAPMVLGIGTHRVSLKRGEAVSGIRTVTIAGGETLELALRLSAGPPVAVVLPPVVPPAMGPPETGRTALPRSGEVVQSAPTTPVAGYWTWQHELGVGLAGLAAVSLAVGVIEHVRYFGKADAFTSDGCGTSDLSAHKDCASLKSQFDSAHTWLVVGYIGAAVLGGTSGYLLWLAPTDPSRAGPVASVTSGMTANFEGRF